MPRARASTDPARRSRRVLTDEGGSASLEFITVGLILLVPLVYLIVALGTIQSQALGVETASRQLARTIASAPDAATAELRAQRVREAIAAEYGIDPSHLDVQVRCSTPGPCPAAGAVVSVTVATEVALPLVPPVFGLDQVSRVPVTATGVQKVSRYGAQP